LGDARALYGEVDDLGDREEPDRHRHEADAIPQEELTERVALDPRDRVETDRGEPQTETSRQEALQKRFTAERGHERNAKQRQHEELRRAEGEHERPDDQD